MACGDYFTVFGSDNGIVMTCGDGRFGCLGHGDWQGVCRPRLIEALLSVDVIYIDAGPNHVVAVGSDGEVFTWGHGGSGRLGHGREENLCEPKQVELNQPVSCVRVAVRGRISVLHVYTVHQPIDYDKADRPTFGRRDLHVIVT